MKPKLSRHIKLNYTNIALLLQEATQKYWKLRRKCCYLPLPFSLLTAACSSFAFLDGKVFFSSWTQYSLNCKCHKWLFVLYIVSFTGLKMAFSKSSLAKYHCLHKKLCYFISSITTERLSKPFSFINSSVQIFLKLN